MKFYNKAITLKKIKIKEAIIPPFIFFKAEKYKKQKKEFLLDIKKKFNNKKIIVRSSSSDEDSTFSSNAGLFDSIPNVALNEIDLDIAINKVIKSYKNNLKNSYVMIQEMITDSDFSGVLTTCDIKNLSPYYVINYFEGSDTSVATSGNDKTKNYYIYKNYKTKKKSFTT